MSVPNGEKLATKQDLADMYQGILPYLGGMPEILANKFSKGDMYSTDEKMIGQWIDGKPLYQKTIDIALINTDSMQAYKPDTLGIGNVKVVIDAYFKNSGNQQQLRMSRWWGNDYWSYIIGDDGGILIKKNAGDPNWAAGVHFVATVQYTKATDSPISIGDETEYSTDEKIIGTWIDGKPIYQKTIQSTLPKCVTVGTPVKSYVDMGIEVEKYIHITGFIEVTGAETIDKTSMPINVSNGTSFTVIRGVPNNGPNNYKNKIEIGNATKVWNDAPVYITIQYTKATD